MNKKGQPILHERFKAHEATNQDCQTKAFAVRNKKKDSHRLSSRAGNTGQIHNTRAGAGLSTFIPCVQC